MIGAKPHLVGMRYHVLASDYDGTLAEHGVVDSTTLDALRRLRTSGRKLVLVTGRQLDDLETVFRALDVFDLVVAENGAVLHSPSGHTTEALCPPPPAEFLAELARRGVSPLSSGMAIVATCEPHESTVLQVIRQLGLELQVTFNKGAVMVLPSGVNKATGLVAALREVGLSAHNTVAVGDAENDHAFLDMCELAVAVANALPSLKRAADLVTGAPAGAGVAELIDRLLRDELVSLEPRARRPGVLLGHDRTGGGIHVPVGGALLVAGSSAGGKTTLATGLLERIAEQGYQYCVIDPEGDHAQRPDAVVLGSAEQAPAPDRVIELLRAPDENAIVNLLAVRLDDRPLLFQNLMTNLVSLRARTGRPHFLIIDEAHHLMPARWTSGSEQPFDTSGLVLITVHPDRVAKAVLQSMDLVAAVGEHWNDTLAAFARAAGAPVPQAEPRTLDTGTAVVWSRHAPDTLTDVRTIPPTSERRRHARKYATGELAEDRSFFFRGPENRLNLRAQNLHLFVQIADGLDDGTWMWHLQRGDYARWFEEAIKDSELARAAHDAAALDPPSSRHVIRSAIEQRYTASV